MLINYLNYLLINRWTLLTNNPLFSKFPFTTLLLGEYSLFYSLSSIHCFLDLYLSLLLSWTYLLDNHNFPTTKLNSPFVPVIAAIHLVCYSATTNSLPRPTTTIHLASKFYYSSHLHLLSSAVVIALLFLSLLWFSLLLEELQNLINFGVVLYLTNGVHLVQGSLLLDLEGRVSVLYCTEVDNPRKVDLL